MYSVRGVVAVLAVVLLVGCGEQSADPAARDHTDDQPSQTTARAAASPSSSPTPSERPKQPRGLYEWLNYDTPLDTYAIALVRGLTASDALRALGVVRRDAGLLTPSQALELEFDLMNPRTYTGPPVVQLDVLGDGVFLYSPYGFRPMDRIVSLSRRGVAAAFNTTVELDTWIRVAKNGELIRDFDPFFYDARDRKGALPEERGLGLGGDDPFSKSWTLLERVTALQVDESWFYSPHPTYVLRGQE